ncbi:MAG: hypothetical protein QOI80_1672 [Solirubrobacteraceae bacterium]|nr:hypothetical protein [Solirubrobacteraceae bacterium]
MLDFPAFEPELHERLLLGQPEFEAVLDSWLEAMPSRPYDPEQFAYGLEYPWARPRRSYHLRDADVTAFDDLTEPAREELVVGFAQGHHPILAIGSNASPEALTRKFAHFEDPRDREILVLAGDLHDFDVGPAATVAIYGAMPATLFESPGTAVRAAVLYATEAQATQLTWSELSYRFGRLDGIRFDVEEARVDLTSVFVYVNRFGHFAPGEESLALAAIPARGRTATPRTQRELVDAVAARMFGDGHGAETVVREVFERPAGLLPAIREHVRSQGRPFACDRWVPYD